jgi:hypothetical protein
MRLYHADKTKIDALEAEMSKKNDEGHFIAEPFSHLRPRPADQEDNWYDWNISNWGTKWDASIIDWCRDSENELTIYCDTAWSPPITLYEYLTEEGWEVDAYYHESGMGFVGKWNSDGGDDYYEYDITDGGSIESLPEDIIDFAGLVNSHRDWMISELEDQWEGIPRTDWHTTEKPVRDGWYEVQTEGWEFTQFMEFKNGDWDMYDSGKIAKWRGLTEDALK